MVARYGVDVPWIDQWQFVPLLGRSYCGQLSIGDLWASYAEHRLFFPHLIMLLLAHLSHWNIRWELGATWLLACLSFVALAHGIDSASRRIGAGTIGWELAASSLLFFSMSQKENWFFGWQLQILLSQLGVILGFCLLGREQRRIGQLGAAILCGILASYSFGNGLLFWGIGGLMLAIEKRGQRGWRGGLFALSAVMAVALYFHGQTSSGLPLVNLLERPYAHLIYVLAFLGAPIGRFNLTASAAFGFCGLALSVLLIARLSRSTSWRALSFPLALVLYALASGVLAAVGRLVFGLGSAFWSRYMAFSSLLWIANLSLLALYLRLGLRPRPLRRIGQVAVATIVVLGLASEIRHSAWLITVDYPDRKQAEWAYRHDPAKTSEPVVPLHIVRERLRVLERLGLSVFRGGGAPAGATCGPLTP